MKYDVTRYPLVQNAIKAFEAKRHGRGQRIMDAIDTLNRAVEEKHIYNVHYQDMKYPLARELFDSVGKKWQDWLLSPEGRKLEDKDRDLWQDLYYNVVSMHDVIGWPITALNKLRKIKGHDPVMDEMKKDLDQLAPIALMYKEVKPYVVKGRVPSGKPPAPENPNKRVRTCGCCFRAIATSKDGTMAHHGYQRPGDGWQTASCPGIHFKPLEESNAGHDHMVGEFQKEIDKAQYKIDHPGQILRVPGMRRGETIDKGEEHFGHYLQQYLRRQEYIRDHMKKNIEHHKEYVANFRKKHPLE